VSLADGLRQRPLPARRQELGDAVRGQGRRVGEVADVEDLLVALETSGVSSGWRS
jgi:hypothetical protein